MPPCAGSNPATPTILKSDFEQKMADELPRRPMQLSQEMRDDFNAYVADAA